MNNVISQQQFLDKILCKFYNDFQSKSKELTTQQTVSKKISSNLIEKKSTLLRTL